MALTIDQAKELNALHLELLELSRKCNLFIAKGKEKFTPENEQMLLDHAVKSDLWITTLQKLVATETKPVYEFKTLIETREKELDEDTARLLAEGWEFFGPFVAAGTQSKGWMIQRFKRIKNGNT